MIKDLKILNGNLELKFNEYTYEYTVVVEEGINRLDFSYELYEDTYINIRNNTLNDLKNVVYVDVYNLNEVITYTFYVSKNTSNDVSGINEYITKLEVANNKEIELYKLQILCVSMFIIIVIIFSIMFKRKHIKTS